MPLNCHTLPGIPLSAHSYVELPHTTFQCKAIPLNWHALTCSARMFLFISKQWLAVHFFEFPPTPLQYQAIPLIFNELPCSPSTKYYHCAEGLLKAEINLCHPHFMYHMTAKGVKSPLLSHQILHGEGFGKRWSLGWEMYKWREGRLKRVSLRYLTNILGRLITLIWWVKMLRVSGKKKPPFRLLRSSRGHLSFIVSFGVLEFILCPHEFMLHFNIVNYNMFLSNLNTMHWDELPFTCEIYTSQLYLANFDLCTNLECNCISSYSTRRSRNLGLGPVGDPCMKYYEVFWILWMTCQFFELQCTALQYQARTLNFNALQRGHFFEWPHTASNFQARIFLSIAMQSLVLQIHFFDFSHNSLNFQAIPLNLHKLPFIPGQYFEFPCNSGHSLEWLHTAFHAMIIIGITHMALQYQQRCGTTLRGVELGGEIDN
ncbi:hypothetical protein VP01_4979g1 [Puccinia sorghi]|uniref:Uncharacterized protein n=1 Tax=Puccinia sorghi TaxID=27349 RepID=A0A0L6ULV0_9BASI|nr:hypothetical protein VP01_4979g1 [Puccinia sorghi]